MKNSALDSEQINMQYKLLGKENEIIDKYINGNSCSILAEQYDCNSESIRQLLIRKNIQRRKPSSYRKNTLNENFFEELNTEHKAWLFGFLLADGCIRKHNDGYYIRIEISEKDKEILDKINILLNSKYPLIYNKKRRSVLLCLSSKKLYSDLYALGLRERKKFSYSPIKEIKEELTRHFIRGYFDGDGWITKDKKDDWFFGIAGYKELLQLFENYLRINCNLNKREKPITKIKNTTIYQLTIGGNLQVMKIRDFLYSNSNIFLKRKKNKFDRVKSTMEESRVIRRQMTKFRERDEKGRFL
ncbi:MAG: hypothetical protein JSW73_05300 [Candidatus Woesearchaeota archaeon]|nr:MAG: hypothetical protein JSW73_05300 [Candidatus Woesearchaeota archaeon]